MIEIEAKALKLGLRAITQVVEARNTIPILSNVLLVASTRDLRLTGTDLNIQIERRVQGEGKAAFRITVGASLLSGIIAKLPAEGMAKLALKDGKLVVSCGRSLFKLAVLPADDFPLFDMGESAVHFSLRADVLQDIIETVRFAISTEETRYYLNGIFLHQAGDQLKAAATDGHRLANMTLPLPDGATGMKDSILPRKCMAVVGGMIDGLPDVIDITMSPIRIQFRMGDDVLISKLIDGTYPDYSRVIPSGNEHRLGFDPRALEQAVERVTTIASDKTRIVALALAKDLLTLSVQSPENGVATEDVPVDWQGPALTIGFNGRYLLDMLKRLPGDTAEAMLDTPGSPTLFRSREGDDALFVLMPVRV